VTYASNVVNTWDAARGVSGARDPCPVLKAGVVDNSSAEKAHHVGQAGANRLGHLVRAVRRGAIPDVRIFGPLKVDPTQVGDPPGVEELAGLRLSPRLCHRPTGPHRPRTSASPRRRRRVRSGAVGEQRHHPSFGVARRRTPTAAVSDRDG